MGETKLQFRRPRDLPSMWPTDLLRRRREEQFREHIPNLTSWGGGGFGGRDSQVVLKVVPALGLGLEVGFMTAGAAPTTLIPFPLTVHSQKIQIFCFCLIFFIFLCIM